MGLVYLVAMLADFGNYLFSDCMFATMMISSPASVLRRNCSGQEPSSESSPDDSVGRRINAFKDSQEVADTSTSHFGGTEDKLQYLDGPEYPNHSKKLPLPESDYSLSSSKHQVESVRAVGSSALHYEGVDSGSFFFFSMCCHLHLFRE